MPLPTRMVAAIAVAMLSVVGLVWYMQSLSVEPEAAPIVTVPEITFERADTNEERERGLSGRAEVPHNYAMLFVFDTPARYGFWMKDMRTSIDIIWLDENHVVTKVDEAILPSTFPTLFYPPTPTRFVLETAAGQAKVLGWMPGVSVALPL
ncbi:MAG: DUF192 domain-containing protein [Candidatus Pacebacteria bacterium]|nr:DUF192 domain-containing protein [Candidatus Paceibacterota bacterium]